MIQALWIAHMWDWTMAFCILWKIACISVCCSFYFFRLFGNLWPVVHQSPLSMGFSRQEDWSGCHFLLQRIFSSQGSNLGLLHFRQVLTLCQLLSQASNCFIVSKTLWSCQLKIGAFHPLPQELNHDRLQLLTFNILWKESMGKFRNEASVLWEKLAEQVFTEVGIFSRFYEPNSCISSYLEKYQNPSWWCLLLMTSKNFLQKVCVRWYVFPFTKITCILTSPCTSSEQVLRAIYNSDSQAIIFILLPIKLTHAVHVFQSTAKIYDNH